MTESPNEIAKVERQATIYRVIGIAMLVVAIGMMIMKVSNVVFYLPVIAIALIAIVLGVMTRAKLQKLRGR